MADAKIQFSVGPVSFSGEGASEWLEKQLDKLLHAAPELIKLAPHQQREEDDDVAKSRVHDKGAVGTLAAFIAQHKATSQVQRFLATAAWLHRRGNEHIQTKDVSKALQDSHQKRLSNPADCLNQNVSKGYCEKVGNKFFVTQEGRESLK